MIPSPLPRNDKLASLTGPNKGKTHITQCGRAAAVEEHGSFFTGRVGFVLQDGHRQGKEGGDGKTVMASCTLSRRVPRRQRVGATRRTSPQSSGAIVHRQHRGRVQNLGWLGRRRVQSRVCSYVFTKFLTSSRTSAGLMRLFSPLPRVLFCTWRWSSTS